MGVWKKWSQVVRFGSSISSSSSSSDDPPPVSRQQQQQDVPSLPSPIAAFDYDNDNYNDDTNQKAHKRHKGEGNHVDDAPPGGGGGDRSSVISNRRQPSSR